MRNKIKRNRNEEFLEIACPEIDIVSPKAMQLQRAGHTGDPGRSSSKLKPSFVRQKVVAFRDHLVNLKYANAFLGGKWKTPKPKLQFKWEGNLFLSYTGQRYQDMELVQRVR
ncbi:MAG: hypothetical protein P8181_01330 [bacterium]